MTDVSERNIYNIAFVEDKPKVWRSGTAQEDALLTMRLPSKIIRYSLESDWGADVINIGYGAEIDISSARAAEVELNALACNCSPVIRLSKAL